MRVGFAMISVTVTRPPSVPVEVKVEVIAGGAVEEGEPRLSVVLTKTIDGSVFDGVGRCVGVEVVDGGSEVVIWVVSVV